MTTTNERWRQMRKTFEKGKKFSGKVWEWIKSAPGALRYNLKWAAEWFDRLDKKHWDIIKKNREAKWKDTSWNLKRLFRENILKLTLALSIWAWISGPQIAESIKERREDEKELIMDEKFAHTIEEQQKIIKELFAKKDIIHDIEGSWKEKQQYWYNRYLWNDESRLKERAKLIEWFIRMVESWDLEMILQKADEAGVPRQCVFLALAESRWEYWANSGKAVWLRQFTKGSAILFWLNEKWWKDNRKDPVKSTEAAMRHLVANYKKVEELRGENKRLTESDKRMLAFYMYNWSPDLVKRWYEASSWNVDEYPVKQPSSENRKYVPRILWMQDALEEIFEKYNYDINQIRLSIGTRTQWDIMYEEYKTKIWTNKNAQIKQLELIKQEYTLEFQNKIIKEKYYNWAMSVLDKEIERLTGKSD